MTAFDALLAYQVADMEVDKFDADLRNQDEYKRYVVVKKYIAEQRRTLARMTQGLESRENQVMIGREHLEILGQRYKDAIEKYRNLTGVNLAKIEQFRDYFEKLDARLLQERREFTEVANALYEENKLLEEMRKKLARASKEFETLTNQMETLTEMQKEDRAQAEAKAKALEAKVDPELLKRYHVIKGGVSMPVAYVINKRCTGCNMELSVSLLRRLKESSDMIECENCGRLLVVDETE